MDKMTDIGTRQGFPDNSDILRESVRKFWQIDRLSVPREDVQKQGFVDKEFWKEVGAQGQGFTDSLSVLIDELIKSNVRESIKRSD